MLFVLSTGHEIGLAIVGGSFITFALLSSFVFPRFNPDFPGKRGMLWYIPLSVCFFVAMIAAVLIFGREEKVAVASTAASTAPASGGSTSAKLTSGPYANGDAAAGKAVFSSAACSSCHTLAAAGSSGTVGPNLDNIASYAAKAHMGVEAFIAEAITKPPPPYVPPGFANAMPTNFAQTLTSKQIADLVAFVAGPSAG